MRLTPVLGLLALILSSAAAAGTLAAEGGWNGAAGGGGGSPPPPAPAGKWVESGWSACSVSCGIGVQTRTVTCVDGNNKPCDVSKCTSTRPISSEACDLGDCPATPKCKAPAGSYCQGGKVVLCKAGYACAGGDAGPVACPGDLDSAPGASACSCMEENVYQIGTKCVDCPPHSTTLGHISVPSIDGCICDRHFFKSPKCTCHGHHMKWYKLHYKHIILEPNRCPGSTDTGSNDGEWWASDVTDSEKDDWPTRLENNYDSGKKKGK